MGKTPAQIYICNNCAFESTKWLGQCPSCLEWGTLELSESNGIETIKKTSKIDVFKASKINSLTQEIQRTGISEFDRVIGGGFVDSHVVLISGEPGIGKSTLLMQVLNGMVVNKVPSLYISGEESAMQVAGRAKRLFGSSLEGINIVSAAEINSIIKELGKQKTKFLILDSIQTVFDSEVRGLPGGVAQIKAVASKIISYVKEKNLILVIVGQVTKEGYIAGPKLLEHLVDTVLELEGDEKRGLRVLRCLKNRYGNANEVGLFIMSEKGLEEVDDPTKLLIQRHDTKNVVGVCKTAMLEGNRVITFEVQSLVVDSPYSLPKRVSEGISRSRVELLTAILAKHSGLNLSNKDIYVNISQGFRVKDPSVDLAVVFAIYSSYKKIGINQKNVIYGELSLSGEIQFPPRFQTIESELKRLGYRSIKADTAKNSSLYSLLRSIK